jgi:NitT/TauT family transport system substrate-binding protein
MPRSSPTNGTTRRGFLTESAVALAALSSASLPGSRAFAEPAAIRITDGGPGTAGAIWRPLIQANDPELARRIEWVNGTPGQVQLQLATGAANVSVFGGIGVAELAARGSDIVIFGPALNNHGRWIVRDNSPYRAPKDLIGKTIATQHEASDTFRHARLAAQLNGIDLKKDTKLIFGPPTANVALFERGDVDAVITIEPTATRLIARGAREIARVGDMWQQATGDRAPLFLIGQAAHRQWAEQNRTLTRDIANRWAKLHRDIRARPQQLSELHKEFGIPDTERAAIELLPKRLIDIYATDWDKAVFANIDRQIDEAVKAGILAKAPDKPPYDASIAISG